MCWEDLTHPIRVWPAHNGKASPKVAVRWLVEVNTYGNRPLKLFRAIKRNKVIGRKASPGALRGPKIVASSE